MARSEPLNKRQFAAIQPILYALILFTVNLIVARRLFTTEFTQHMNSNEGSFIAIGRYLLEHWPHVGWFPLWFNGVPFENTYSPLQQVFIALLAKLFHASPALAYHALAGFVYCLGPVSLF